MKVLLSGYYGFGNIGDEAVLEVIKSHLKSHDVLILPRSLALFSKLIKADVLVSGGGTLFQDKTSYRSFLYYIGVVAAAKLLGKKVMILAQGFGPLTGRFNRYLAKLVLNRVEILTLRDKQSLTELKKLGVTRPKIELTADPVFCLEAAAADKQPTIGIAIRQMPCQENYQVLAQAIDWLAKQANLKPVFLPFHLPQDYEAAQKVAAHLTVNYEIAAVAQSPREMLKTIAGLKLIIGMRLHSLIFATISQVPMLGLAYDPKVDSFMQTIDQPCLDATQLLQLKTVKNWLEKLINSHKDIEKALGHRVAELKILAERNFDLLRSTITDTGPVTVDFAGIQVDNLTINEASQKVENFIQQGSPHLIVTPNPEIIVACQKDEELKEIINSASLRLPDGISMVVVSKILKKPLKERVSGIDLMLKITENKKCRVFLLGGAPGIAAAAAQRLNVNVVGLHHGYFDNDQEVVEKIRVTKPEVLFVGLGAGRQERWANHHLAELRVPVVMVIGGSLDVISGKKRRAPQIFQKLYIEWLYRLITEPNRWQRQLALPKFLWLMFKPF